jgi:hypothetical protein
MTRRSDLLVKDFLTSAASSRACSHRSSVNDRVLATSKDDSNVGLSPRKISVATRKYSSELEVVFLMCSLHRTSTLVALPMLAANDVVVFSSRLLEQIDQHSIEETVPLVHRRRSRMSSTDEEMAMLRQPCSYPDLSGTRRFSSVRSQRSRRKQTTTDSCFLFTRVQAQRNLYISPLIRVLFFLQCTKLIFSIYV